MHDQISKQAGESVQIYKCTKSQYLIKKINYISNFKIISFFYAFSLKTL